MGCQKGKAKAKRRAGNYVCDKCDAVNENKGKLCKPKKLEKKK